MITGFFTWFRMTFFQIFLFILIINNITEAQDITDTNELKQRFGIYADYNFNFHASDFNKLINVPSCCPDYTTGYGNGYSVGISYDYPIDYEYFIKIRGGFTQYLGLFKENEPTTVIIDGVSKPGAFEHRLDTRINVINIQPVIGYRLYDKLFAHGGLGISFPVSSNYNQIEEIVEPSDRGTFLDGTRTRNISSGKIQDIAPFQLALMAGFSYELPLNKKHSFLLSPELYYSFMFTHVVSGLSWAIHSIHGGISLKYKQPPAPPPPPPPPLPPPYPTLSAPQKPPILTVKVKAVGIDSNNVQNSNVNIKIEDFISLNMRPLLNYIFFDENSPIIPPRYIRLSKEKVGDFDLNKLQNLNTLQTYYQVLNIIGKRLKLQSNTNITLIGSNCNTGIEKGNLELSKARANAVKDYLTNIWGIEENRIKVEAKNLPKQASRSVEPGGDEENRRVEIITNDWLISEPILTIDTMRVLSTAKIRFLPDANSSVGIKNWELPVNQGNKELVKYKGKGTPPHELDWTINQNDTNAPGNIGNISYYLSVTDSIGQVVITKTNWLPVEKLTIDKKRVEGIKDKEFEYYSLILFDYGKAKLDIEHQKVLDFIKNRLTNDATVNIYGYTDRMGDDNINKRLSDARAKIVAQKLKIPQAQVVGKGETELIYNNDLPEGRFYCRTVRIEIVTPVREN